MFYGECVEKCEDFALGFGNKRTGYCITLYASPGHFLLKTTLQLSLPTLLD
jgi:hypothetical protein